MSELSRLDKRLTELEQLLSGYQLQLLNEAPTNAEAAAVGAAGEAVGEYEERQTLSESMQLLAEQSRAATVRAEEVSGYLQEVELRLLPVAEGLAAKACHTDPVTGQRRYGDAAQAKIHSCVATAAGLCAQLQAVQQQLMSRVQGLESELALLLREQQERLAVASTLSEKEAQKENRSAVEAQLQLEERRRKEQELAEKARAVRAKRQKEQEELNELHQQIEKQLLEIVLTANEHHRTSPGVSGGYCAAVVQRVHELVSLIRKHVDEKCSKILLQTTVGILQNILSRPDDQQLRRIRLTHPAIAQKLTGLAFGANLLLILGFSAQLVEDHSHGKQSSATANDLVVGNISNTNELADSLQKARAVFTELTKDKTPEINTDLSFLWRCLAPHSIWDVVLVLEEPPVDLVGIQGAVATNGGSQQLDWITWFDTLTQCKESLQGYL